MHPLLSFANILKFALRLFLSNSNSCYFYNHNTTAILLTHLKVRCKLYGPLCEVPENIHLGRRMLFKVAMELFLSSGYLILIE